MCPLVSALLGAYYGKTCPFYRITDYVRGVTAMTAKLQDGKYISEYDYETGMSQYPKVEWCINDG